jgi:hypothetical protein
VSGKRLGGLEHVLRLWLDGRLVWTAPLHLPFDPTESRFDIGSNLQGFGSVQPDFPASIQLLPYPAARKQEFLDRNLAVGP